MTYAKGYKVELADVIDQFNAQVKNVIASYISWHRGNYPSTLPNDFIYRLKEGTSLPSMTASNSGTLRPGQIIVWADFFAKAQALFLTYVHVRRINFKRYKWANTNGNSTYVESTPYVNLTAYGIINDDEPSILNNFDGINYKGSLLKTTDVNGVFSTLVNTWAGLKTVAWNYTDPCHSNCHSSCHGSGGYR